MVRAGLCAAIVLGFTTASVLAHDAKGSDNHYDNSGAPHETPHKAEPPTGGHDDLAAAATNPISNLIQFQMQNSYSPHSYNANGYYNVGIIQPVIPVKLAGRRCPC